MFFPPTYLLKCIFRAKYHSLVAYETGQIFRTLIKSKFRATSDHSFILYSDYQMEKNKNKKQGSVKQRKTTYRFPGLTLAI